MEGSPLSPTLIPIGKKSVLIAPIFSPDGFHCVVRQRFANDHGPAVHGYTAKESSKQWVTLTHAGNNGTAHKMHVGQRVGNVDFLTKRIIVIN